MSDGLLSVGIDLGTSTTQLVISRLTLENSAGAFAVPKVDITKREVLYRSPIHFTPLLSESRIDAAAVRAIVEEEYRGAGVTPEQFQTGAVIITGETARKENAREVLEALAGLAGDFVVATAGPDLESVLAARGAGADTLSARRCAPVLHYDIGGGTANLALFDGGKTVDTGCLDVGGRLIKIDPETARITYVFHKLRDKFPQIQVGAAATEALLEPALKAMAGALAEAGGVRPKSGWLDHFITHKTVRLEPKPRLFTFSGGVADCMWKTCENPFQYGDIGPLLAREVREEFTRAGCEVIKGAETIRATVVGAGSYATEVSGSTVFYQNMDFPLKNRPVLRLEEPITGEEVRKKLEWFDGGEEPIFALKGVENPRYGQVRGLAEALAKGVQGREEGGVAVVLEADMAKALGQCLAGLGVRRVLCLDSVVAQEGSYLDILAPTFGGAVVPVVVKTLAFEHPAAERRTETKNA